MKRAIAAFGVLAIAAVALAMLPATRDVIHWRWTSHQDTKTQPKVPLATTYEPAQPKAQAAIDARVREELNEWNYAQRANTVSS